MSNPAVSATEVRVTLPDGSVRTYAAGSTGADVAASIGAGLAKAALAIRLDGVLKDLKTPITGDAKLEIVTLKDKNETELLDLIRHDGAHVMAQAVQELFPGTQITFG
ncbi:MAG: TGS domain-containing protein, partial [Ferrovibrio sp.]